MRAVLTLALMFAAIGGIGCGNDDAEVAEGPIEALETNVVAFGGVEYRVILFRQMNPRNPPDKAVYDGPLPADQDLYAAFVVACNASDGEQIPTKRIHLEDAFGEIFRPIELEEDNPFAYRPRPLEPGECLPDEGSAADRTFSAAVVVFRVPFEDIRERPMILALDATDADVPGARVELDL